MAAAIVPLALPIALDIFRALISNPTAKSILSHGIQIAASIFPKVLGQQFTADQKKAAMTTAVAGAMPGLNEAVIQGTIPELKAVPDEATVTAAIEALYQTGKPTAETPAARVVTVKQATLNLVLALLNEEVQLAK
jgi:hypothetical protein